MNHRTTVASALACVLAAGLATQAHAGPAKDPGTGYEKCFGIAKAGQNDCANLAGTHSCAGESKADMHPGDWKFVAKGTCKDMKGLSAAEAKAKLKM